MGYIRREIVVVVMAYTIWTSFDCLLSPASVYPSKTSFLRAHTHTLSLSFHYNVYIDIAPSTIYYHNPDP